MDRRDGQDVLCGEGRLERLLQVTGDGFWEWDLAGGGRYASPGCYALLDCREGEIEPGVEALERRVHPDDLPGLRRAVERLLSGRADGDRFELCCRCRTRTGAHRWLRLRARVSLRGEAGRALRLSGTICDCTAQSCAEESLQESEKRYRGLFEAMQESFVLYEVILDGDGRPVDCRFLEVNPAFERLTGLSLEEVRGRTVRELFPELGPEWIEHRGRVALTGEPAHFENFLRPLGKWFEVSAFRPAPGQVATLSVDISGRKKLEEQFLQVQKMETVGRLAGGVAHDFNNLLTIITGNTEIALAGMGPGEPLREELDEVRRAAARAAELTRKLLAFSRRQIAAPKVIDLNAVLLDMERMLRRLIGEHIDLRTVAAAGLHPVRIDPGQVEQVLTNLVVNARDAMPLGGRLLIETANARLDEAYRQAHPEVMEGEYVLLAVSDTGCGMDAEVRSHLFEPFFTTKPQGKGTGLGLSTCYGIVKQNGGSIWVYSEAGQGTSVKVYLPAADEPAAPEERAPESAALPSGTETVLLVEDEPGIRRTAQRILAGCGYRVCTAANGEEALALDRARQPEGGIRLLITDVIMPGMGGRELGAKLLERYPGMKVLYMSGYTDNSIVHHGLLEEGIAFLHKPFTPAALVRKVREVLDG